MRRARVGARWGLLAAGALGLVGSGAAQAPLGSLRPVASRPALARTADAPHPVRIDQAHLEEMQVELAWLADPALFPYQLVARVNRSRLEVHGYVPNRSVRKKALAAAHTSSRLEIVDALRTYPSLAPRSADQPPQSVRQAVAEILAEEFPNQAPGFRVAVQKNGRVTVTGVVRSLEEKWKVSCCLRRVRGCTSADNRLGLADGAYPMAAQQPMTAPAPRTEPTRPVPPVVQAAARDVTRPAPPAAPVGPPAPPVVRNPQPQRPAPVVVAQPARMIPAAFGAGVPAAPESVPPTPPPPVAETKPGVSAIPPGTPLYLLPVPDACPPEEVARRDWHPPVVPAMPRPAIAVPVSAEDLHPPTELAAAPAAKPTASSVATLVKYEEPAPHGTPRQVAPKVEAHPLAPKATRPSAPVAPCVTTGAILFTEDRPAGRAERAAAVREMPPAGKAESSYVTTGTILISDDRPAPRAGATAADSAPGLRRCIQTACGSAARDVLVLRRTPGALEVRFTARDQAEADRLSARMLALPELAPYQLSFQVRIEP